MASMKKLTGTKWGANMKTQVYIATVRLHMEYASNVRSFTARTNLDQLAKAQNAGLKIIISGMKRTPISEVERTVGLLSLDVRREEKLLRQSEKTKRIPSHPLHSKFEAPIKTDSRDRVQITWSKRSSRNTSSPHEHATNHRKCFKTIRTDKQKLQRSS